MILFSIGLVVLLFVVYRCSQLLKTYLKWRSLQVIPGPKCSFFLGQFQAIRKEPFMAPHTGWLKDVVGYDAPLMRYNSILGRNMLMIFDPAIIKEMMTAPAGKNDCRFYKPMFFFPSIIGKGLVTLEGEEWVKHRRLIQPAFSVPFLKEALNASVAPKVATFIQLWMKAGPKQEIDLASHLSALTLDVIGDVGFSHDCKGMKDMERWADLVATTSDRDGESNRSPELTGPLITAMTALLKPDMFRLFAYLTGLGWLDPLVNPKTKRARAALNNSAEGIIANARQLELEEMKEETASKKKKARSLMQVLMNAHDAESSPSPKSKTTASEPGLTDRELRDELKTFLLAGHETTSTWCYWAMFAMAKYPDVQEKLYEDVMKTASSDTKETISLEEVDQMEYLSAFLQECLRLFPPVGMLMRLNRYEETFAGYKIPPGTNCVVPVHLLHRHPKYWGLDAEKFQPERWLSKENSGGIGIDTKGFTFLPFGAGGHNCIGYRFATLEAKLIMAHMVRALRVEIAPSQRDVEHTFTSLITIKTKPGLKVVVKQR